MSFESMESFTEELPTESGVEGCAHLVVKGGGGFQVGAKALIGW